MLASIKYHRTNKDGNELGFTLIELLVVILIIGILASIAIPAFLNQRQRAVDAQTQQDLRSVNLAVNTWILDNPRIERFNTDEVKGNFNIDDNTRIVLAGDSNDYCIKAYHSGGKEYRSNGGPYLIYTSISGVTGSSEIVGHVSALSCGTKGWVTIQ